MGIKYSVAVATYNGEKYIARQIRSILEQTFPVHEIIVSDDGSNDKTVDIVKSLDYKGVSIQIRTGTDAAEILKMQLRFAQGITFSLLIRMTYGFRIRWKCSMHLSAGLHLPSASRQMES